MQIGRHGSFLLTYCTNIHPGNGWHEVFANLRRYAPELKARIAPDAAFGIGLRLSGEESRELLREQRLREFREFLDTHGLYVFTLNGFPYGPFHKQPVKAEVHAPDWRDEERVSYTLRLIEILAFLLPDGVTGSISTSPLSYKPWIDRSDVTTWVLLTRNIVRVAERLIQFRAQGTLIHLDLEPEPDGLIENSVELVTFYEDWLLPLGGSLLADSLGVAIDEARSFLLDHIQVCLDTCHMALAYESPEQVLDRFGAVGIRVGKVQVSSALKMVLPEDEARRALLARALRPFAESTYLHQVIQRNHNGTLRQYPDLPDALPFIHDPSAAEWRVHFHVPIFIEHYDRFSSTQDDILRVFALLGQHPFSQHLEIETYTWDALPPDLKTDIVDSINREYEWVLNVGL